MPAHNRSIVLGAAAAALAGAVLALQVRTNGALGDALHSGTIAAGVSFAVGAAGSLILVLLSSRARRGLSSIPRLLRTGSLRWWELLGGLSGALFIFAQSATGAILGAAMFSVGIIAGQMLSGLFVDRAGLAPAGPIPITAMRATAAGLGLIAGLTALIGSADLEHTMWLMLLPFAAGISVSWQQAVNSSVAVASSDPLGVVFLNFMLGLLILLPVGVITLSRGDWAGAWTLDPVIYLGGLLGIVFVVLANIVVARVGVLVFGLASVTGQLIASVALDLLMPTKVHVTFSVGLGVVLALAAVALSITPRRSPGQADRRA